MYRWLKWNERVITDAFPLYRQPETALEEIYVRDKGIYLMRNRHTVYSVEA